MNSIKESLKFLSSPGDDYEPKITFVLVQKRHHTRFFPQKPELDTATGGNIPVGTVVDRTITHPENFDFYLQSYDAIKGTGRPCHYHVLHDDNIFDADMVEQLAYRMCFLLQRCAKVVSLPAPTYFAHLATKRAIELIRAHTTMDSASASGSDRSGLELDRIREILGNIKNGGMYYI